MGSFQIRTDLALEARENIEENEGEIHGVRYEEKLRGSSSIRKTAQRLWENPWVRM